MIKLYGSKMTSAFRCHLLLKEMGVPFEEVPIDLSKGEHKSEAFLKLNPNGKVPCMVEGDFILWESMAINRYLTHKYQPALLGNSPEQAALIDQWSYWAILSVQPHLFNLFLSKEAAIIEQSKAALSPMHQILDNHLAGKTYMLGDNFTLADINVGSVILVNMLVKNDISAFSNIGQWVQTLFARPSFQ
ncbi:glutathione S-transferase family protein [bacterium]|nr:glutathione S-transferase family protein [bacterium]